MAVWPIILATPRYHGVQNLFFLNIHFHCCKVKWQDVYAKTCHATKNNNPNRLINAAFAIMDYVMHTKSSFYLQDMVPWGQSAITSCYRVPDNLLDDNVAQWCVFPSHNAKTQLLFRLLSIKLHDIGLGHETGSQRSIVWRKNRGNGIMINLKSTESRSM